MNDIEKALDFFKNTLKINVVLGRRNGKEKVIKQAQESFDTAIKCMEHQLTNGWIPVSSGRLPEAYRDKYGELIPFLVCINETEYPFRAFYNGKKWGDGMFELNVIAWQTLPEPYKEFTQSPTND